MKKGHWSEHFVSLMTFANLNNNRKKTEVFRHPERSYDQMRLSLRRETSFTNSLNQSSDSMKTVNKTVFIDNDFEMPRKLSKTGSLGTISNDSQSDTDSERGVSVTPIDSSSLSSASSEFGSVYDINESQKRETVRVIQRFGYGFEDSCLFPLALSLDLSDLTKGKTTWETINSKADLVLDKWCSLYSR